MEPKTTATTNSSAELRAGLERLRARYDGGAAAPAVFTVIKAIELRDRLDRAPPGGATMSAANIFPLTASSTVIAGIEVILPRRCQCGETTAIIGSSRGPHHASAICSACGVHRAWLSGETYRFISSIIDVFGRPDEPIIVSMNPRTSVDNPATATAAKTKGT